MALPATPNNVMKKVKIARGTICSGDRLRVEVVMFDIMFGKKIQRAVKSLAKSATQSNMWHYDNHQVNKHY